MGRLLLYNYWKVSKKKNMKKNSTREKPDEFRISRQLLNDMIIALDPDFLRMESLICFEVL